MSDLCTVVDLLAEVNRRECLIEHDRQVRQRCCEELEALLGAHTVGARDLGVSYAAVVQLALELRWRDTDLERALAAERARGFEPEALPTRAFALLTRLAAVKI